MIQVELGLLEDRDGRPITQPMKFMLSTYSQSFAVFSTNCPHRECNVPYLFDFIKFNSTVVSNTLVEE